MLNSRSSRSVSCATAMYSEVDPEVDPKNWTGGYKL